MKPSYLSIDYQMTVGQAVFLFNFKLCPLTMVESNWQTTAAAEAVQAERQLESEQSDKDDIKARDQDKQPGQYLFDSVQRMCLMSDNKQSKANNYEFEADTNFSIKLTFR